MKTRTLFLLLIALLVLAAAARWTRRPGTDSSRSVSLGSQVLALEDLNAVTRLELSGGTQQVTLARSGDTWVIPELWNHPADFAQIGAALRQLDRLKVGDVIRSGSDQLAEFGLAAGDADGAQGPLRVSLFTGGETPAVLITIGQPRTGPAGPGGFTLPDSQYVRVGDGPVLLAEPYLDPLPRRPMDWIRRTVLDLPGRDIESLHLTKHDGTHQGLVRTGEDRYEGRGTLEGAAINVEGAGLWMRAFQGLTALGVADPATDPGSLGLDAADVTLARTAHGLVVTATLGGTNSAGERYARFAASFEEISAKTPDDTNEVARVEAARVQASTLQATLAPWVYLISQSAANQLTLLREQLVAAPSAADTGPADHAAP